MIRHDDRLAALDPRLADVVRRADRLAPFDLLVVETARTIERQKQLVAQGASRTLASRHIPNRAGYAEAVDLAPVLDGEVRWDWPLFGQISAAMKTAAADLGVAIVWGGDWRTFKDGPHFELGKEKP